MRIRYRDYVIGAFNSDLGYDRFVLQQLAADQLPSGSDRGHLAAMGFLTVGRRFLLDQNEIIDDRIDVVCRGFLGLTVTCARCHDHKFDPIPTEDYYSLYGVFASTVEPAELPVLADPAANPRFVEYQKKLAVATKARDDYLAARRDEFSAEMKARLSQYLKAGQSVGFDPRSRKLDEQARRGRIEFAAAARRDLDVAAARFGRRPEGPGAWPLAGIRRAAGRSVQSQGGRAASRSYRAPKIPRPRRRSPAGRQGCAGGPALRAWAKWSTDTRRCSHSLKLAGRSRPRSRKPGTAAALPEPEWESLRKAIFGDGGPLAVNSDGMRFILDQGQRNRLEKLNAAIQQLNATDPASPPRAMVVNDSPKPVNPHVFMRGNPGRPGPAVPRRFLKVLSSSDRPAFQKGSGRLELAQAIATTANPLTARVFVNRVWLWHFGKGLVGTPSDFGVRSDPPSHPELLDYLAGEFIKSGWSIKRSAPADHAFDALTSSKASRGRPSWPRDPENRLLWRFNRQRLDFESMRDSVLAVSGSLGAGFRRACRRRSNRRRSCRGARFTDSSTARTLMASTARLTSPFPTRPARADSSRRCRSKRFSS